ncbi:MAG: FapA family protein [Thermodesulfobacteriota bacterium]|nr:FapA family protein [Thermodesulfobacteriota bacterium]
MTDAPNPTDRPDDLSPLFVEENDCYRLCLTLTSQQMECLAEIEVFPPAEEAASESACQSESDDSVLSPAARLTRKPLLTPPDLFWYLQQNNIIQTIDYPAVYEFCAALELGVSLEPTVLARGIAPQTGADGWFELNIKITGDEIELEEDETGKVDHKTLNAYSEIEPGQKLGIVHSPLQGIPGITVQGLPVAAEPGQPFELKAGEGVILKYNDRVAFAEKPGRAIFEKQTIAVVDLLVIPGDVDLTVGNIDFNGFVEIKGEIQDDFDLKSTKGVKLCGSVGACQIESDGSIEMVSMAGKNLGRIICRGDLKANFLNQATVLCYGDVTVSNEIRNSLVKATGSITVERGAIIGGQCVALSGIEAKTLGTASGQKTQLLAGIYFPDADRFTYLRHRLKDIDLHIRSLNNAIEPLKTLLKKDTGIAAAARKRLTILTEQLDKLGEEKRHASAEISSSTPQLLNHGNPKINVQKVLMEGVEITLGNSVEQIKIERRGPLSIIENSADEGLRYLGLSKLSLSAGTIEEQIREAELSSRTVNDSLSEN